MGSALDTGQSGLSGLSGFSRPSEIAKSSHPVRFRYGTGGINLFGLSGLLSCLGFWSCLGFLSLLG